MKTRAPEENTFTTHDGQALHYRRWPALTATTKGAVVLLHRGHEHSGRLAHLVHELNLPDFAFFAWDARRHGLSPGPRGFSPSVATSLRDVQCFVDHIAATYDIAPKDLVVVGHSVGAVLAAGWAHDYAPDIRGMILASPAFRVKLYAPFARPLLRMARAVKGDFFVNSYVKPKHLTHDAERIADFETDSLIARPISVNMLLGLEDLSQRLIQDAAALTVPTQLLISGSDWVVAQAPQHRFYEQLGAPIKERHVFPDFYHDTLGERDRDRAIQQARRFVVTRFSETAQRPSLLEADKGGFTRAEADRLASPLPAFSLRGLYWSATRAALRAGGWISKGLAIGRQTGFDSGSTLDYVYENEARGRTPLGTLIDRFYLDSIGWKGIRQRKIHVEELLGLAMARTREAGSPLRILDVAAGHGRYVLDAIRDSGIEPESLRLRDYDDRNVAAGTRLIEQRGLSHIASFAKGDAFDPDSLAAARPQPTIGIVSGLYELFADNAAVRASLGGLAQAVPEGGYLIYTCQPWHPQIELIARALTSHRNGQPWVMRRRTQAEMDQLVAEAGFRKIDQRVDAWGIFTVSLAKRIAA
jgi:alpha-beta hydrolase superfamily lysophospholipase